MINLKMLKKMGLMTIVVLIFTKGYGSQHIRDNYGYCINNHNRHHYNFAFNVRDPQGPADFTPLNLTNFLARHWNLEGSPGVSFAGTLQGDVKAGFQEIENKLKINIAQMNYFLHGLDSALNGDMGTSNGKFDEVEKIYADQGGYPGHWDRHHRGFRDALLARFTRQDDRSNGLESRITHVNDTKSAEISTLKDQLQQALSGIATLKDEVNRLRSDNEILIARLNSREALITELKESLRPPSARRGRSVERQNHQ